MAARKTTMDRLQELVRLHRLGTGTRESARLLKMSPNTERRYREALEAAGLYDDQKVTTWIQLHVELFEALGGVPQVMVPDNLKAAVIRAAFTPNEQTSLNRSYRELARHYGFKVNPTPPYSPQKKGKVESGVKYLKTSVLQGRDGQDAQEVQAQLEHFLEHEANVRVHGTTRRVPRELLEHVSGQLDAPRFARNVAQLDLLSGPMGGEHEPQ